MKDYLLGWEEELENKVITKKEMSVVMFLTVTFSFLYFVFGESWSLGFTTGILISTLFLMLKRLRNYD